MISSEELQSKVQNGFIVETLDDVDDRYLNALKQTLLIVGDTELVSIFTIQTAIGFVKTLNSKIAELAIIQDEIGHAHIAYRLLRELGEDVDALLYSRQYDKFKHPYAFDFKIRNHAELMVLHALWDRAGYTLLSDVHKHTSYGPWKRALAKVDTEETFHLRTGEVGMKKLMQTPTGREELQKAIDWMFIMGLEFFGTSDSQKKRIDQLEYRIKGLTNDEMRQQWLDSSAKFLDSIGLKFPAHFETSSGHYVLDCEFPCRFDPETRRWDMDQRTDWLEVIGRFRARGPECEGSIENLRRGRLEFVQLGGLEVA